MFSVIHPVRSNIYDIYMVDAEDSRVDILVRVNIFRGERHDVSMIRVGVDDILGTSYVVGGVIDPHDVVLIHTIFFEEKSVKSDSRTGFRKVASGVVSMRCCDTSK